MVKTKFRNVLSVLMCMGVICSMFCGTDSFKQFSKVSAAASSYKFDLGGNPENGYTSVSASQAYSSWTGYGFRNTSGVKDVAASGSGALSDAVQFTDTENKNNTFDVDLEKGLYRVTVTLGNTNRTSVYMEDMLQIVNMTGNNAVDSIVIPVTDGQLNIRAAAGKAGYPFSISALEISKISDNPEMPKTIWMCGDSTVCNYYPLDTSVQAGWGQVLNQFVDTNIWQVRNMAASGQYAKGFVEAGQFDAVEYYGKKGDIYIISIGINDTNYSNEEEYYNTVTDMTKRAKEKGMTVILVKQQGRATDVTNNPNLKGRWFGGTLDRIGQEQNVQVIDLFNLFFDYCKQIGQDATNALYMDGDSLHPNRQGALKLAELASAQINSGSQEEQTGAVIEENRTFRIKNVNSGLYMEVENSMAENGTNVSQQNGTEILPGNVWKMKAAENGYYYICSAVGNGEFLLDLDMGSKDSGTNIGIYNNTNSDAQLFKFLDNGSGGYIIATKVTADKSAVEVKNAITEAGGNIQQWEINGHNCQSWILEPVTFAEKSPDEIILGDVNHDGVVNVFDNIILKRNLNTDRFRNGERLFADTNADGFVDTDDVSAMNRYLVNAGDFESFDKKSGFYYADEASFSRAITENVNAGFKRDRYINFDNCVGSFLEWSITAPESGNYLCSFSIANGSTANRTMKIEVNSAKDYWIQDFLSTGSWTDWTKRGIVLPLVKGKNIIRMTSNTEQGGPNVDSLYIEKTDEPIAEIHVPE